MPIVAESLAQSMFLSCVSAFPTMEGSSWRANPAQGVPPHRAVEEMCRALAAGCAQALTSTLGLAQMAFTTVGPTVIVPHPLPATFPTLAAAAPGLASALVTSLGWLGPQGQLVGQKIVDGLVSWLLAGNVGIYVPYIAIAAISGGTLLFTLPSIPGSSIAALSTAYVEATPYFRLQDQPSLGVAPGIQLLLAQGAEMISQALATMSTTYVSAPSGSPGSGVASFSVAMV